MSKDTISVNMNVYDIPILVEQLKKLQQENKQLKEDKKKAIEYINKNILVGFNEVGFKSDIVAGIVVNDLLEILGDKEWNNLDMN